MQGAALQDNISYFLRREERSKEASTLTKPSPIWEGCNCLRGQAALRQGFGMALRLSPFGFAMVVYIPACAAPWKGAHRTAGNVSYLDWISYLD